MFRNVLIMDHDRLVNIGGRADIFSSKYTSLFLDMIIVVSEDETTFDVIMNRFGDQEYNLPITHMKKFITSAQAKGYMDEISD